VTTETWQELLDRARAKAVGTPELLRDLDALRARVEENQAEIALDTKRRMADLAELHNANRLVTVGLLTVGMAHEFGTPLGIALARAQMILGDDRDLAEARVDAEEIVRQVKRLTQMCREVLDYARPRPPARMPLDVVQIVRQMIGLLVLDARKRSAKIVVADDPPPTMVLGDASKLMQVVTNLVLNAAQAMPKGGTVTVRVQKRRVAPPPVTGLPEDEYVCVDVQDVGTGIRSADLSHVFETFFTTKKQGEGTGLGLAVSYRIAREHDGWIGVVTEEGRGSTFTVYLPPYAAG
jgi:two-component system, NtrC family, sensor kinase